MRNQKQVIAEAQEVMERNEELREQIKMLKISIAGYKSESRSKAFIDRVRSSKKFYKGQLEEGVKKLGKLIDEHAKIVNSK